MMLYTYMSTVDGVGTGISIYCIVVVGYYLTDASLDIMVFSIFTVMIQSCPAIHHDGTTLHVILQQSI